MQNVFLPEEVQQILAIPIRRTEADDILTWGLAKDGRYIVRSGYRMLIEMETQHQDQGIAEFERSQREKECCKRIWASKLPDKIKDFAWRVCKEILPVCSNLYKRQVCDHPIFPLCKKREETTMHALRECDNIVEVWRLTEITVRWTVLDEDSTTMWMNRAFETNDQLNFEFGLVVMWAIWGSRHAVLMNEENRDCKGTAGFASRFFTEYRQHQPPRSENGRKDPPPEFIKLNYGSALKANDFLGGVGS